MALGSVANNPGLKLKVVPIGLTYFHAHKFRSRAVVEFGRPIDVPLNLVQKFEEGGSQRRDAVSHFLDQIHDALKRVTVRAPDYETLEVKSRVPYICALF